MLGQLAERELTIGELATPFSMSFAGASKHVRVLENAGLVTRKIRGRTHQCRLQAARLAEADAGSALRALLERKARRAGIPAACGRRAKATSKEAKSEGVERWMQRQSPTPMAR